MKGKNSYDHMIRCRKGFDKIQHSFMIKTLRKLGIEGSYLNTIMVYMKRSQQTYYSTVKK